MTHYRWGYVIVNYHTFDETRKLLNCLEPSRDVTNRRIYVVDNGRSDEDKFRGLTSPDFVYVPLDSNVGYARASNVGIRAAREARCDFVAVMNSDVIIPCVQQFEIAATVAYESARDCAVVGPSIVDSDGNRQSPLSLTQKSFGRTLVQIVGSFFYLVCPSFLAWRAAHAKQSTGVFESVPDVILHGACFVLTPSFFGTFCGLYKHTFMYCEEYILYEIVRKAGLHTLFCPEIEVYHARGRSSAACIQNLAFRLRARAWRQLVSLVHLLVVKLMPLAALRRFCE